MLSVPSKSRPVVCYCLMSSLAPDYLYPHLPCPSFKASLLTHLLFISLQLSIGNCSIYEAQQPPSRLRKNNRLKIESIACRIWASANPQTKSSSTFTMKPEIGSPNDSTDDDSSDFDQVEHVGPPTNGSAKPLTCEVKEYEERRNLKGEKVLKEVVAKVEVDEKKDGKEYVMKSYKSYGSDGVLESSRLEIYSPHIQEALREVIKEYPGVSFCGDLLILHGTLKCVFHYRKELESYRQTVQDRIAKLHIHLLLRFMEKNLKTEIRSYEANVATSPSSPAIEFKDLWMVFLPGEPVITGQDEMNQILSLVSTKLVKTNGNTVWMVIGKCFTHDGKDFGYLHKHINIEPYQGTKTITSLPILPLRYYGDDAEIGRVRRQHIARGKKFCSLKGNHHRFYNGRAYMVGKEWEENIAPRPPLPPGAHYYSYRLESVTV